MEYRALNSEDATKHDVDIFVELVLSGGAVDEHFVRMGAKRPDPRDGPNTMTVGQLLI